MTSLMATLASTTQATGAAIIARGPRGAARHYRASRAAAGSSAVAARPAARLALPSRGSPAVAPAAPPAPRPPARAGGPPPAPGVAGTARRGRRAGAVRAWWTACLSRDGGLVGAVAAAPRSSFALYRWWRHNGSRPSANVAGRNRPSLRRVPVGQVPAGEVADHRGAGPAGRETRREGRGDRGVRDRRGHRKLRADVAVSEVFFLHDLGDALRRQMQGAGPVRSYQRRPASGLPRRSTGKGDVARVHVEQDHAVALQGAQ